MASQGNSQGSSAGASASSSPSAAAGAVAAVAGAALAGVLVASQAQTRADDLPTHPSAPYRQMAFLPESNERLMRTIRSVAAPLPSEEEEAAKARRVSVLDMAGAARWGKGVHNYAEVRPQAVSFRQVQAR